MSLVIDDLKERTVNGALARVGALGASLLIRVGSLSILARLLNPKDFGLVGMVTAFTGVLSLFRDCGLSAATIQRADVTEAQTSTLFWVNLLLGAVLASLAVAGAPFVASFYHEPRLAMVTCALAAGFLFNAAGIQHSVRLQRAMRFTTIAMIDFGSLIVSTAVAITLATGRFGYWALVAMTVTAPLAATIGFWLATGWIPGRPRRGAGVGSMMRFGGTMTLNGLVIYIGANFEKVLLGRFWGADAIGLYGRAYQLIRIPTDSINSSIGEVAFSALSRVQHDPPRLRSYFLKGYSLVLALTLPATLAGGLCSDDLVRVFLGPKWTEAAVIFRYLAPTIMVVAISSPLGWLLSALGKAGRLLKMAMVVSPLLITCYLIGLPYGPRGVALAYSAGLLLWVVPVVVWSIHGTPISLRDMLIAIGYPLASVVGAGAAVLALRPSLGAMIPILRLALEIAVLLTVYVVLLMFVAGQKSYYLDIARGFRRPSVAKESQAVA